MGAPYSQDLRVRVLGALDDGMSKMAAHKLFGISRSTLDDWLLLREQTGAVVPVAYKRGPEPTLQDTVALRAFVEAQPDRTLEEMAVAWQEAGGRRVSPTTFSKALGRLGYTRKKRASSSASATKNSARLGSNRSSASHGTSGSTSTRRARRTP